MKRHFSSLTAENVMKWSTLQPVEGTFRFEYADKVIAFAEANGMKVRGHTLCWHQQIPDWVFLESGVLATRERVLERLRIHITTVMNHFKGKVYAWDVVNEAIDDGGSIYRASKWYNICGTDYIFEAFIAARAADPEALLFYNDYSAIEPAKRDKICSLLQELKNENLIDGVGMQGHWNIDYPANDLIIDAINAYKSIVAEIHITEMDVSVYTSNSDPESAFTTELQSRQKTAYSRFFAAFRMYKNYVNSVTIWGLTDQDSWLNNWPVANRTNYPLLFDTEYLPKESYFAIIDF
jgi:endo-1,4-beta-xylanase